MNDARNFKGVWIPKEIWLCKDLTPLEKMYLVEIDSLDDEINGCYASNKHFEEMFGQTGSNISRVIENLKMKGWVDVEYIYNGKEIDKRVIRIKRPPYPERYAKNEYTYTKNDNGVYSKLVGGYTKNDKDRYTYIDKHIDNKENSIINNTKRNIFKKPTIEEIKEYCSSRNNNVDAEMFYDFYESKGWMIGKNKMKDWKSAVRTWERKINTTSKKTKGWEDDYWNE